jgi:hypothetical protein
MEIVMSIFENLPYIISFAAAVSAVTKTPKDDELVSKAQLAGRRTNKMSEKAAIDVAIGSVAITAPLWAVNLTVWVNLFVALGGLVLLAIRIHKSLKE